MSDHPYKHLPDRAFWRRAVAQVPPSEVNPAITSSFAISPTDAVMTAGSCFAQYIGPMLRRLGFNYLVTEPAHALFPPELATEFGYGMFTARTGNIYTARQLLQLYSTAPMAIFNLPRMSGSRARVLSTRSAHKFSPAGFYRAASLRWTEKNI